jgi:hypothetical protein
MFLKIPLELRFGQVNIGSMDAIGKILRLEKTTYNYSCLFRFAKEHVNRSGIGPETPRPGIISFIPTL